MIFNSKQLEELESIHDSTGAFEEEGEDDGGFEEVGEGAMDWRRSLVEEATENIKRAKTRPVEPDIQYNIGSMLFDREEKRFARVQRSVPGYLKIGYLSGGDREYGALDVIRYLKAQGADKRLSELAEQLALPELDILHDLERLGITPLDELETSEPLAVVVKEPAAKGVRLPPAFVRVPATAVAPAPPKAAAPAPAQKKSAGETPQKPLAAKPQPAKPSPATTKVPTAAKGAPAKTLNGTSPPAKVGGKANPIDDPNGYIKAHYTLLSNRELARLTGLSEHTIRRKLGEWSLKRKRD